MDLFFNSKMIIFCCDKYPKFGELRRTWIVFVVAILPSLLCGGCAGRKDSHLTTSVLRFGCVLSRLLIAVLTCVVHTKLSSHKSLKW